MGSESSKLAKKTGCTVSFFSFGTSPLSLSPSKTSRRTTPVGYF